MENMGSCLFKKSAGLKEIKVVDPITFVREELE